MQTIDPAIGLLTALHAIRAALPYIVCVPAWAMGAYFIVMGCTLSGRKARQTYKHDARVNAWRRIA